MPSLESVPVDQHAKFLAEAQRELYDMATLCARYGISRKTSCEWLERYAAEGRAGLADRSHADVAGDSDYTHRSRSMTFRVISSTRGS